MTQCPTGKVGYETKDQALRAQVKIRKRVKRSRRGKRRVFEDYPYRCKVCNDWHFTSSVAA